MRYITVTECVVLDAGTILWWYCISVYGVLILEDILCYSCVNAYGELLLYIIKERMQKPVIPYQYKNNATIKN